MRIELTGVFVHDQAEALAFYTDVLGFRKRHDIPLGQDRWLTLVSPEDPDGPELLLEPSHHPAVKPYRDALMADGIPLAQFAVDDIEAEHQRLTEALHRFSELPRRGLPQVGGGGAQRFHDVTNSRHRMAMRRDIRTPSCCQEGLSSRCLQSLRSSISSATAMSWTPLISRLSAAPAREA